MPIDSDFAAHVRNSVLSIHPGARVRAVKFSRSGCMISMSRFAGP